MKITLEPGFDWIKEVSPKLPGCPVWCPANHFGYLEKGTMKVKYEDSSSEDEAEEDRIRQRNRNRVGAATAQQRRQEEQSESEDEEDEDVPSAFGEGKGWAGAVQAMRPPQFNTGEGNARTEAKGLGKVRVGGFKSSALHRMRAIEEYRTHRGTAGALLLPGGGRVRKAEDGTQQHTFENKTYDD